MKKFSQIRPFSVHSVTAYDINTINQNTYKRQADFRYFSNFWTCKGLPVIFIPFQVADCLVSFDLLLLFTRKNCLLERVNTFRNPHIIVQLAM